MRERLGPEGSESTGAGQLQWAAEWQQPSWVGLEPWQAEAGAKASAVAAARPPKVQNQGQKVATTKEKNRFWENSFLNGN